MKDGRLFRKYYHKIVWIGIVKAMLSAILCGLCAVFLTAIVMLPFYLAVKTILIVALCVFGGVFVALTPVLYFVLYRPTVNKMNREIDKLGLEERIVTMRELENDGSYIAMCQREDAKKKLGSVKASDLKYHVSKYTFLALSLALVLSVSMTALSSFLSIKHEEELSNQPNEEDPEDPEKEPEYVTVRYVTADERMGHIEGETEQIILKGSDAQAVVAVPAEGFIFLKWSDDFIYAERWDWNVLEDLEVEAIFFPMQEGGAEDGRPGDDGGDGGNSVPGGEEGGDGVDNNGEGGTGSSQQDDGGQGAGSGEEGGDSGDHFEGEGSGGGNEEGPSSPVAGTGGRNEDNSIIDGETDYKTAIDDDYQDDLENDDSLSPELKELIERYLESLKP